VHVPLRRFQILVSGKFLNRSCWGSPHCEMRTERVPEDMHPRADTRRTCRSGHMILHDLHRERLPTRSDEQLPAQMTVRMERRRQTFGHRHVSQPPSLRRSDLRLPV
jgi:hypothetical protein